MPRIIDCPVCGGSGKMYGPRTVRCKTCNGGGRCYIEPVTDEPDIPEGNIDHDDEDRRAFEEEKVSLRPKPSEY